MPRKARIDAPGAVHHIIIRGIEKRQIFRNDADRADLLQRFGRLLPETQTDCFAWALIPNHAHFLLRTGVISIAALMRRVLTGYAVSFNKKYRRRGKLFQSRYKSILCQEDLYLKELVRYIHLNPLRARLAEDLSALDRYPWCGHSVLMNKVARKWQNTEYVLTLFGKNRSRARRQYRGYVENGIALGKRPELTGGGLIRSLGGWGQAKALRKTGTRLKSDERILGESGFVEQVLSAANERMDRRYQLKARGFTFEMLVEKVAQWLKVETEEVLRAGKQPIRVKARDLLCYFANRELGMSTVHLARILKIGQPAISRSVQRGEKIAENENLTDHLRKSIKA